MVWAASGPAISRLAAVTRGLAALPRGLPSAFPRGAERPASGLALSVGVATLVLAAPFLVCQQKYLPPAWTKQVTWAYFWPTLPLTMGLSWWGNGALWSRVDEVLVLGIVPAPLFWHLSALRDKHRVVAVINMLTEYEGPVALYHRLGIRQLHLPTIDHQSPSAASLKKAVEFIREVRQTNLESVDEPWGSVLVHCKAGHGRSAAVAFVWLVYSLCRDGQLLDRSQPSLEVVNRQLCAMRRVRPSIYRQASVLEFIESDEFQKLLATDPSFVSPPSSGALPPPPGP